MKKLVIIVTVPVVLETWFKGQPRYLSSYYDVTIITSDAPSVQKIAAYENVTVKTIEFNRKINPILDAKVFKALLGHLDVLKPDIVYTLTPKAGLLGMLAAWVKRVPVRIHNVVGLPLMEAKGKKKVILEITERMTYFCCTHLYANSFNLQAYIQKHLTRKKVHVVGQGSVNGVDVEWFSDKFSFDEKSALKESLGIARESFVMAFIGRIVKDKGVNELIEAFEALSQKYQHISLLILGDFEEELDPVSAKTKEIILNHSRIVRVAFKDDVRPYLALSDLFVLPSYREGLPNVLIEAGSSGIPLLATNINGCNEVIIPEHNGVLVNPKDVEDLSKGIERFVADKIFYETIKSRVRQSIIERYAQNYFWSKLREEFLACEKEVLK